MRRRLALNCVCLLWSARAQVRTGALSLSLHFLRGRSDSGEAVPAPKYAPLITARLPEAFWDGASPEQLEDWYVRACRQRCPRRSPVA
jgi:hypothetical protein